MPAKPSEPHHAHARFPHAHPSGPSPGAGGARLGMRARPGHAPAGDGAGAGVGASPRTGQQQRTQRGFSRRPLGAVQPQVFGFNESLDQAVIKPVATTYQRVTPNLVQTGVSNFFGNLRDVWSALNLFLQFKPKAGLEMSTRVLLNSTLGIYGLLDLASPMGLERRAEDFGQTLGYWGVGSGPYLVMPVLGPSTLRDATSYVLADRRADPIGEVNPINHRNVALGLKVVDQRSRLLSTTNTVDAIAFDRYSFVRDAYLQRRRFQIYDGNPPPEDAKD